MVTTVLILVFALGARLVIDTDVWWHIRAGATTLDSGVIRHDPFSFTKAGVSWPKRSSSDDWRTSPKLALFWRWPSRNSVWPV